MAKKTSILIADDHAIVRQGIRALLERESDFTIVGETGDGIETLKAVERLKPDVVILDIGIPGLRGIEVARQVRQQSPKTRIVILTMQQDESFVRGALEVGVSAYVLKGSSATDLVHAIREAMAGRMFLCSPFSDIAIREYLGRTKTASFDTYDTLTPREKQIFQLAAEGLTNSAIARRLSISQRTVEVHRANAMHKLGLRSPVDLVRYAIRKGIIPPREVE